MPAPVRSRPVLGAVLAAVVLVLGGIVAAAPSTATELEPSLERVDLRPGGDVQPQATIENEEAFCGWLSGFYVNHPTYYTVRVYNCRHTDIFIKGVYLNGSFATCVLVPARHSRHLGGSIVRPMEDAQIC
ncbi:hypothetical protein [Cellulomonas fengjieae]|uniref:Secreted protein n=1 Tax=Cellulomonas fengjieae TaxID=2819978 RepID=A0ABS3SDI9_9CELL|nr:hypothetical protein [Cellulomonas fengjieae]MBO3083805.1 hypothetical protein [Cellulomonas fengjieae]MBO3101446.1 hypothetical protein [Cellulomonas fengjieae]QVI64906.1 hypothetical protein KG102_12165 [Cellulomonas fengjieae]